MKTGDLSPDSAFLCYCASIVHITCLPECHRCVGCPACAPLCFDVAACNGYALVAESLNKVTQSCQHLTIVSLVRCVNRGFAPLWHLLGVLLLCSIDDNVYGTDGFHSAQDDTWSMSPILQAAAAEFVLCGS